MVPVTIWSLPFLAGGEPDTKKSPGYRSGTRGIRWLESEVVLTLEYALSGAGDTVAFRLASLAAD